jgi:hypothetical protein
MLGQTNKQFHVWRKKKMYEKFLLHLNKTFRQLHPALCIEQIDNIGIHGLCPQQIPDSSLLTGPFLQRVYRGERIAKDPVSLAIKGLHLNYFIPRDVVVGVPLNFSFTFEGHIQDSKVGAESPTEKVTETIRFSLDRTSTEHLIISPIHENSLFGHRRTYMFQSRNVLDYKDRRNIHFRTRFWSLLPDKDPELIPSKIRLILGPMTVLADERPVPYLYGNSLCLFRGTDEEEEGNE